ncbi:hypothetical protein [Phenylobacterium sp.]|uniref:hypothetical protein n=1 Tax=Phenylobacterium sp. TaxID=1871053 RepID=UPI00374CF404
MSSRTDPVAPEAPVLRLTLGVTGHREANPALQQNREKIEAAFRDVLDTVDAARAGGAPPRLHTLLADGVDQLAAQSTLGRGWDLVVPLPFGRRLNAAINARPQSVAAARAIVMDRRGPEPLARARARAVLALGERARLFELADRDAEILEVYLATLARPGDHLRSQRFAAEVAGRVALAARIVVEQSDLLIAVWDGLSRNMVGGTGHTISTALDRGCPVIWIDARAPQAWRILLTPEALSGPSPAPDPEARRAQVAALVGHALVAPKEEGPATDVTPLSSERWRDHSHGLSHAYRRVEALFGGDGRPLRRLRQTYETPEAAARGSGATMLAALRGLPGGDPALPEAIETLVLRRFAWTDAISARLSDVYRGGMTANFLLSAAAILSGVVYLPVVGPDRKAVSTIVEFAFLICILTVTTVGRQRRWHSRWFQTRRVAEYLRHSPILLALGVARPPGRWVRGADTAWPEAYARQALREVGLPRAVVTTGYLRAVLAGLLAPHVGRQHAYHVAKAARLSAVHHNLDQFSQAAFVAAVAVVAGFLALYAAEAFGLATSAVMSVGSRWLTLLGAALPTLGAAAAGVRYFGDFERFAAISEVTAEKLAAVRVRIGQLLAGAEGDLDYAAVSELAHEADEIVVTEIERWQSVFGGKYVTVPV